MHDAAIEPSSPARYPDEVLAKVAALSAEARSDVMTSASGGAGAAAAGAAVVGLVVPADVDVGRTVRRAISADRACACRVRSAATCVRAMLSRARCARGRRGGQRAVLAGQSQLRFEFVDGGRRGR